MKTSSKYLFVALLIIGVSCNNDDESVEPNEETTFGIRHDKTLENYENIAASLDPDLPNFSSVIAFEYSLDGSDNYEFIASGVLIDPEWILTAGHNFFDIEEQRAPAPISGINILVGNDPNNPSAIYAVQEVIYHPLWLEGFQDWDNASDLCLVKLSTPINNITPATLYANDNEQIGGTVWHCGFGDYSSQPGQNPDFFSKKHAMENILDRAIGDYQTTSKGGTIYTGGLLGFDFDNPKGTINTLGDNFVNDDEAYLGQGTSAAGAVDFEGTTVEGDSGGPLFLKINGDWVVIGILGGGANEPIKNHIDGDYGDISIYARVSTAYNWIQSIIE